MVEKPVRDIATICKEVTCLDQVKNTLIRQQHIIAGLQVRVRVTEDKVKELTASSACKEEIIKGFEADIKLYKDTNKALEIAIENLHRASQTKPEPKPEPESNMVECPCDYKHPEGAYCDQGVVLIYGEMGGRPPEKIMCPLCHGTSVVKLPRDTIKGKIRSRKNELDELVAEIDVFKSLLDGSCSVKDCKPVKVRD